MKYSLSVSLVVFFLNLSSLTFAQELWTPTSTGANVPSERYQHSVVWTGSKMIIWGGNNYSTMFNTGGMYDPLSDSWTATSLTNAPSIRFGHTAIWTGDKMIVWGGQNVTTYQNTGGVYDPSIDSWVPTSTINAPTGRQWQTAIWTGSKMIIWGGINGTGTLNDGGIYDPATNTWTSLSTVNAPAAREFHTAVWTGSKMIIWGGINGATLFNTGGVYDPSLDSWTSTTTNQAPSARRGHTGIWTGNKMIIWGGYNSGSLNTGGIYDPVNDSWSTTTTNQAPSARQNHTAVWSGSNMIIWGGYTGNPTNSGGIYDPASDSWTATSTGANVPAPRYAHTSIWTGCKMIVWGGASLSSLYNTGGIYSNSSGLLQSCNYTWTQQSSGTTNTLYGVKAVNEQIVWTAGDNGTIRRTINGGSTWTNANGSPGLVTGFLSCVEALDANTAFVGSLNGVNANIYKTTNGGTSWTLVNTISNGYAFYNSIKMINATTGFAHGDPFNYNGQFRLSQTTNGGDSWIQMVTAPTSSSNEAGWQTSFQVDPPNIWFGTVSSVNSQRVFHSTDLGLTWTNAVVTGTGYTSSVHFNNSSTGIAVNSLSISGSSNGGNSFTNLVAPQGVGNINCIYGDDNDYWFGDNQRIYRSTNNGLNWQINYTSNSFIMDIEILRSCGCSVGWAVGGLGNIFKMTGSLVSTTTNNSELPSEFKLYDNYPNPFNPSTKINFDLPKDSKVTLTVYDILGRVVKKLVNNEFKQAGRYSIDFNAFNYASGVYFYRIEANDYVMSKKMVLVK